MSLAGSEKIRTVTLGLARIALLAATCALLGCGSTRTNASAHGSGATATQRAVVATTTTALAQPARHLPAYPIVTPPAFTGQSWHAVATIGGRVAAWEAQRGGVTLLRFDQRLVRLALHAGALEPGGSRWRYGDRIGPGEIHRILAAFNGGFKLDYGSVGYFAGGRAVVPLSSGLGSIVTYKDGTTQIGAWQAGVPAAGKPIESVRQNLRLMVDHGQAAASVAGCVQQCWGHTLGGGDAVARSALGIDAAGDLVWGAGESLTPAQLAGALVAAGVLRAVELDINPFWVAGYLYVHHGSGPSAVPVVPGQHGIEGQLLAPDNRDFFTVSSR